MIQQTKTVGLKQFKRPVVHEASVRARISVDLARRMVEASEKECISPSEFIRRAIELRLSSQEPAP